MFEKSPVHGLLRSARGAGLILCVLGSLSCGDEALDDTSDVCAREAEPASGPTASDRARRGFVLVRDVLDRTDDDTGLPRELRTGRVQAGFADFSTVTSTPAQVMALGPACVGVVSRPVSAGDATPLPVDQLRVEGTARGTVRASEAGPGTYIASGEPVLGTTPSALRFVAEMTAGGFGAFDASLPGLRGTVELTVPEAGPEARLTVDALPLAWTPADADWVEITVRAPSDEVEDGGQVVCRVADVGCFTLPAAATAFLLANNASRYTLSVQLHRYRALEEADRRLEVEAIAETRLTLANGAFDR